MWLHKVDEERLQGRPSSAHVDAEKGDFDPKRGGKTVDPRNDKERAFDAAAAQWSKRKKMALDHKMLPQTREKARHLESLRTGGRCSGLARSALVSCVLWPRGCLRARTLPDPTDGAAFLTSVAALPPHHTGGRTGTRTWMPSPKRR